MTKVPSDPNMSPEVRRFLDDLARKKTYPELTVSDLTVDTATIETLTVDGKDPYLQGGSAHSGLDHTWYDNGTLSSGTLTVDPLNGFFQKVTLTGAVAIAPHSTHIGSCVLHITNGASANGSFSSWTKKYSGSITTTNGHMFAVPMYFFGALGADYSIQARQ